MSIPTVKCFRGMMCILTASVVWCSACKPPTPAKGPTTTPKAIKAKNIIHKVAINTSKGAPYKATAAPLEPTRQPWVMASKHDLGLCVVKHWPQHHRVIVVHTTSPCADVKFQAAEFSLVDTETSAVKATFESFLDVSDDAQHLLVQQHKAPTLIELKSGAITTIKTTRAQDATAKHRVLLDKTDNSVWIFERIGTHDTGFTTYVKHSAIKDLKNTQDIQNKALFWPSRSTKQYHTTATTLQTMQFGGEEKQTCAVAQYTRQGKASCVHHLKPIHGYRHLWRPDFSVLLNKKTTTLELVNRTKEPLPALPTCKVSRLRFGEAPFHVLIQCKGSRKLILWRPTTSLPVEGPRPGESWQLLPSLPQLNGMHRLIDPKTKQHARLDPETMTLWVLPPKLRLRTPTLAVKKPSAAGQPHELWRLQQQKDGVVARKVGPFMCDGKWTVLNQRPQQNILACVPKRSGRPCDVAPTKTILQLDHQTNTYQRRANSVPLTTGDAPIFGSGVRVHPNGTLCPVKQLVR